MAKKRLDRSEICRRAEDYAVLFKEAGLSVLESYIERVTICHLVDYQALFEELVRHGFTQQVDDQRTAGQSFMESSCSPKSEAIP